MMNPPRRTLVTGASRGIGLGVAEAFLDAGDDVAILADDPGVHATARELEARYGRPVRAFQVDITDAAALARLSADVGTLDVLVNNAGLERPTPIADPDPRVEADFRRVVEINVVGSFLATRALLGRMRDGGAILFTASIWGKVGVPEFSAYVASKHAVIGLVRALSKELGERRIRVNAVCPGWVETQAAMASLRYMSARSGTEEAALLAEITQAQALPGLMTPRDVGALYVFLASDAAANITGQSINVDRGEVRL